MAVIGVDPGAGGAIALCSVDPVALLWAGPSPSWGESIAGGSRKRLDIPGLLDVLRMYRDVYGAHTLVTEKINGWAGQGGSSQFEFGWAACAPYALAVALGLKIIQVRPGDWKYALKVPGKRASAKTAGKSKAELTGDVVKRADELMPSGSCLWRGPKGGALIDVAEAALIAYYGAAVAVGAVTRV